MKDLRLKYGEEKLPDTRETVISEAAFGSRYATGYVTPKKEDLPVGQLVQADNKGLRFSKGKLRYDLFPPEALEEIVRVYTRGAEKYAERNWERGMKWSECLRALKSHMTKWEKGEVFDDELTDCRHLAMVAWNAIALLVYEMRGIGENNIPGQQDEVSVKPAGRMSITGLPSLIANPTETLPSVIEKKSVPTAISSEMIAVADEVLRLAAKNPMVAPATLNETAIMDKVVDILSVAGRNERE